MGCCSNIPGVLTPQTGHLIRLSSCDTIIFSNNNYFLCSLVLKELITRRDYISASEICIQIQQCISCVNHNSHLGNEYTFPRNSQSVSQSFKGSRWLAESKPLQVVCYLSLPSQSYHRSVWIYGISAGKRSLHWDTVGAASALRRSRTVTKTLPNMKTVESVCEGWRHSQ